MNNIIWIDDEWEKREPFIDECNLMGFSVVPFTNAKDGLAHYRENHLEIDGLILDAKMFAEADSESTKLSALSKCQLEISRLQEKLKRAIPFVIYTGQPDLSSDESFLAMAAGPIFSKNKDNGPLFEKLSQLISATPEATIKKRYSTLYKSCFDGPMEQAVWEKLMPLLQKIESREILADTFNEVRQTLEAIFQSIHKRGLLPTKVHTEGLNPVSRFLAGDPFDGMALSQPLPKSLTKQLWFVLETSQDGSHHAGLTKDGSLKMRIADLSQYLGPNCRLANIMVLMTADIASWFAGLLQEDEQPYRVVDLYHTADLREEGEATSRFDRESGRHIWSLNTGRNRKCQWSIPSALAEKEDFKPGGKYWCVVTTALVQEKRRRVSVIHSSEQTKAPQRRT